MSDELLARLFITGNSPGLILVLKEILAGSNLQVFTKAPKTFDYLVIVLDLADEEADLTKSLLNHLSTLTSPHQKAAVVLACGNKITDRNISYYRNLVQPVLSDQTKNVRLLVTFDLYSDSPTPITHFEKNLQRIISENKINVSSNGTYQEHFTEISDLASAITRSLFSGSTRGETFVAITETMTDLELAYLIKKNLEKNNQSLDINLDQNYKSQQDNFHDLSIATQANLNWLPKNYLSDHLLSLIKNYSKLPPASSHPALQPLAKIETKINLPRPRIFKRHLPKVPLDKIDLHQTEKKIFSKLALSLALITLLLLITPFVTCVLSVYLSTRFTYQSFQSLRQGNQDQAKKELQSAINTKNISSSMFHLFSPVANLVLAQEVTKANNYLLLLDHGQSVLSSALETYALSRHLYLSILGQEPLGSDQTIEAIKINLITLNENLSQIQLLTRDITLPLNLERKIGDSDIYQQINLLRTQISSSLPLLDLLNQVLRSNEKQNFVVLIQDNNELRATGGFLNSLITLTFDQKRLVDAQVEPSLAVDRLVQGNINPPSPVRQLLNQANWTFRDSNVDADFKESGKQITWFLERFKNIKVSGLIALDLNFFNYLFEQTGGITLPSGQKVTADNFNTLASTEVSDGNDIISTVGKSVIGKLLANQIDFIDISRAGLKTISKNEAILYFPNPDLETLAQKSGLSGNVVPTPCNPQLSSGCQPNTVYLNETNYSVAKINYYLKRSQNHALEITKDGQVNLSLDYKYTFPVPVPTGSTNLYKAYYQFYLPHGSSNLVIALDNQPLDQTNLIQTSGSDLDKIEFSASMVLNQNHDLKINLTSPTKISSTAAQIAYSLSLLKQEGTSGDKLTYSIRYPDYMNPTVLTLPMNTSGSRELTYQTDSPTNLTFGILFKNLNL